MLCILGWRRSWRRSDDICGENGSSAMEKSLSTKYV